MDLVEVTKSVGSLWILLIVASSVQGVCDEGWAGPMCNIQCHCGISTDCLTNGSCHRNEPCSDGYFGPSCQYVDLLFAEASRETPSYLNDNDDATCIAGNTRESVTVDLKRPFRFSWLRLVLKTDNVQFDELRLKTNGNPEECPKQKWTKANKTVDIMCGTNMMVSSFTIDEPLASELCSLHFSGGRNLALKQNVTMSSVAENETVDFSVDGDTASDGDMTTSPCPSTQVEATPATWHLTFDHQYSLYRVQIFSSLELLQRLALIKVKTYSSNMTLLDSFLGPGMVNDRIVNVTLSSDIPVKQLRITAGVASSVADGALSLCEVEAYGVAICPNGRYGLACEKSCTCLQHESCFAATGGCLVGCPRGLYGKACDNACPGICLGGSCNWVTGNCDACPSGRSGPRCNGTCPTGRYGLGCTQTCSPHCSGSECNHMTGACDRCPTGRSGPACEECSSGTFGNNCSGKCPVNCNASMCDRIAGTCFSCTKTFAGARCTDCVIGKYGDGCDQDCPAKCNKRLCHETTGVCKTCMSGYEGSRCEVAKEFNEQNNLAFLFPIFAIVPMFFGGLALFIKRKKSKPTTPTKKRSSSLGE